MNSTSVRAPRADVMSRYSVAKRSRKLVCPSRSRALAPDASRASSLPGLTPKARSQRPSVPPVATRDSNNATLGHSAGSLFSPWPVPKTRGIPSSSASTMAVW